MITPLELWQHAVVLTVPTPVSEAGRRLAVARLYYAAFHAVGQQLSFDTGPPHGHQRLIEHLKHSRGKPQAIAGGRLESLRDARVKADYKIGLAFASHEVGMAVNHATTVYRELGLTTFLAAANGRMVKPSLANETRSDGDVPGES